MTAPGASRMARVARRLEAECLLSALVERTESLEIAGEPAWRPVNMLRTLESLPLRVRAA